MLTVHRRLKDLAFDTGEHRTAVFGIARIIADIGKRYAVALADVDATRAASRRSEINVGGGVAVKKFGVIVTGLPFAAVAEYGSAQLFGVGFQLSDSRGQ